MTRIEEYGVGRGTQSHCCHCASPPDIQVYGFYLCQSCRDRAEITHYTSHGVEHTVVNIDGCYYYNKSL